MKWTPDTTLARDSIDGSSLIRRSDKLKLICRYFATYELLKKKLSPPAPIIPGTGEKAAAPPLSIGAVMLAGGTAGVAMWSVAIPPDVSGGDPEGIAYNMQISPDITQNRG
jgi:hypothetical protein